jgi:hypothetical protein
MIAYSCGRGVSSVRRLVLRYIENALIDTAVSFFLDASEVSQRLQRSQRSYYICTCRNKKD